MAILPSEETKHVAIANQLRRDIENDVFSLGTEMPSEAALVKKFGVARGTIRQALATLRDEGLIRTSRGRRPLVHALPLEHSINDYFTFSSWVRAQQRTPGQRTIEIVRRRRDELVHDSPLPLPDSEYVVQMVRLRLIDGRPTMLERTTFHDQVGQRLMRFDADSGSVFEYLVNSGAELDEGTHLIDASQANALDAELLEVGIASPVLRVRRTTSTKNGEVLEYSEDRYRPDRASFRIRNHRENAVALV